MTTPISSPATTTMTIRQPTNPARRPARGELGGPGGNWVGTGSTLRATGGDELDQIHQLARVRVAGSNPFFLSTVFRSIFPVESTFQPKPAPTRLP